MASREKLDEREWKIRYIAEQRFPGFTDKVRRLWVSLDQPVRNRRSLREIALAMSEKIPINTEDKSPSVSTETKSNHGSEYERVAKWMENILNYESALDKLDDDALFDVFRNAINDLKPSGQANVEEKQQVDASSDVGLNFMLRYAYWEEDDLLKFLSHGRLRSKLALLKEQVKKALKEDNLPFPEKPNLVLDWARRNKLSGAPKVSDLQETDPDFIWHATSKRMQSIWTMLATVAEKKYIHDKGFASAVTIIAEDIARSGRSLGSETVRKILSEALEKSPSA